MPIAESKTTPAGACRVITRMTFPSLAAPCLAALCLMCAALPASAQSTEFELDAAGEWETTRTPAPGSDEAIIAEARRLLATGEEGDAKRLINQFIASRERTRNPWLPEAYLVRGDIYLAQNDEFDALFDYERIIREYPESAAFATAIERELGVATRYVNGLRRKILGLRIESARLLGEELLIRVQERMPSSTLAEQAAIELADHYYRERDMRLAAEMYGIFIQNFPTSDQVTRARERQIFANIASFKGPRYDATGLLEASALIENFQRRYPAEAERAGITVSLASRIDESAAQKMLETARWYFRRGDEPAARFMLRRVIRKHPRSTASQTAIRTLEAREWIEVAPTELPPEGPLAPDAPPNAPQDDPQGRDCEYVY